jgi:hypothetical protein
VEKQRNRDSGLIRQGQGAEEIGKVLVAEYKWVDKDLHFQWSLPGMMAELK